MGSARPHRGELVKLALPDQVVVDGDGSLAPSPDVFRVAWASPASNARVVIGRLLATTAAAYIFAVPWRPEETFEVPRGLVRELVPATAGDFGIAMAIEACAR